MNKTNDNTNKAQKSDNKTDEYRSFNAAKEKLSFLKNLTDDSQPDQESPGKGLFHIKSTRCLVQFRVIQKSFLLHDKKV